MYQKPQINLGFLFDNQKAVGIFVGYDFSPTDYLTSNQDGFVSPM
ncbi:MAG TPA: hypothetical protein VMW25_04995 [Clostridia bacterium]|nr:hypothetical protein [Clostridia bacterium]